LNRVLIVDDDETLTEPLAHNLRREGFEPTIVGDGAAALAEFDRAGTDAVLLEMMLPDISGTDVCRQLNRYRPRVPIIMVTSCTDEIDKLLGFDIGVDDYVTKPYSTRELTARIRAILRRRGQIVGLHRPEMVLAVGPVWMDVSRHEVTVRGEPCELPPKEFRILEQLLRKKGCVLTKDQIFGLVWGSHYVGVGDGSTVKTHIKRLRHRIEADPFNPRHVLTVRGFGFKFEG
jgi:two-component system response regulator RegX3